MGSKRKCTLVMGDSIDLIVKSNVNNKEGPVLKKNNEIQTENLARKMQGVYILER